jgi:predicted TIM-barrel fold metal-dependent hydrolase
VMTRPGDPSKIVDEYIREREKARERAWICTGQVDPHARIRDMDLDGVAADVVFAGGQNGEVLPFLSWGGFDQGPSSVDVQLRAVGAHIFNEWLAGFVSVEPARHVGVMQIAISNVAGAVRELEWGRAAGLRAVNLPAPQHDFPAYTDPGYEPFWDACEALDLPLLTHVGGGETPLGVNGPMGGALLQCEQHFMGRRGLWQLIFGGVFERHPRLKLVFTEQRQEWVAETLRHLDSVYEHVISSSAEAREKLPRTPSEYWSTNCFIGGSFMAPFEAAARGEIGVHNLMWGTDYPHMEGTWPNTRLALRNTFARVPEEDTRLILGENAIRVYGLDENALRVVADRIGPKPEDLTKPLAPEEYPIFRGFAFREHGVVS